MRSCQVCGTWVKQDEINCNVCSKWARRIFDRFHLCRTLDEVRAMLVRPIAEEVK